MSATSEKPPPDMSVRIVIPHEFLVKSVTFKKTQRGKITEVIIEPYLIDKNTVGTVAHVVAQLNHPDGTVEGYNPVDIKVSPAQGVKFFRARGLQHRKPRKSKAARSVE